MFIVAGLMGVLCERAGITGNPRLAVVLPLIASMLIYARRIRLSGEDLFFASVVSVCGITALHWLLAFVMPDGKAGDAGFVLGFFGLAAYLAWRGLLFRRKNAHMLAGHAGMEGR